MFQQIATVAGKRQITIPSRLFKQTGLKKGSKVIITVEDNKIKIESAINLVESLAGSVKVPTKFKGKSLDEIIEQTTEEYFAKKFSRK